MIFYERLGARPIANTLYETPVKPGNDCPPYLMFDGLGVRETLSRAQAQGIVKAILERKYGGYCDESYNEMVINSFTDDPVKVRTRRYTRIRHRGSVVVEDIRKTLLVVNDQHAIHHVRERGYVESPVRIKNIFSELSKTTRFRSGVVNNYSDRHILEVHDRRYYKYFKKICEDLPKGQTIYPYVFPIRHASRAPKELSVRAGYYCFDTFTPLNMEAFLAARRGVNCTLTAADEILSGAGSAYVLTRPPGHHAERALFGGFCYFNNCAIAAQYLSKQGRVAILDIDYHHGNGQQQIFYNRSDILTISIHGHPSFAYPYFSGFSNESGEGEGRGFNHNFPLPESLSPGLYSTTLRRALKLISRFKPDYLVLALGLDTAKGDPTGTWDLRHNDFILNGSLIGSLKYPTLIIQEGGYRIQSLGSNARAFFEGFHRSRLG